MCVTEEHLGFLFLFFCNRRHLRDGKKRNDNETDRKLSSTEVKR